MQQSKPPSKIPASVAVWTGCVLAVVYAAYYAGPAWDVVRQTGVSRSQARQAIALAQRTNANRVLVLEEAIDKAKAIKRAAESDSARAAAVMGIAFSAVGGITSALITPKIAGVTVQYTVSGTDNYYDSQLCQTDVSGRVSFNIPAAQAGVIDTISVSAVLSGTTERITYTWPTGATGTEKGCHQN